MRLIIPLVILSLLTVSCNTDTRRTDGSVVVSVGSKALTRQEIEAGMPKSVSPEDSIFIADKIVRQWIRDNLLYEVASKNSSDKEHIDQLVENYRKSLIVYQYQEQLVNEKLSKDIGDEEMKNYFEANSDKFKLDQALVKGLFLKIPSDARQINDVREWCKSSSPAALEKLEKYTVGNAVKYDYFLDNWMIFSEIMDNLPTHYNDPDAFLRNNKSIELKDSSYCYFVSIREYLLQGDQSPFEYAKPVIKEVLVNQKKMSFLKSVEDDLYNKALGKGQIKFYTE
ncbi:MAG: peptidyl-prolyl cis-trans isomerase [Dysgonamonadaceae bacterium]|jgi:hypothetical protein|nr:peptidyl-prolyl cis-trans isomerase [Dysgonamonadaceae bacterium]